MTTDSSKHRSSKPRFSLRTLLIVTSGLGCGLGWFATEVNRAKQQRNSVAHIRRVRGNVTYDYQLEADWLGGRLLRNMMGNDFLHQVRRVSIHNAHDMDLETLRNLTSLYDLRLNSRQITDPGLSNLRNLRRLERLDLWCDQVTDQGLQHLGALEDLQELDLLGTKVTDTGLAQLSGLTNLRVLRLRNTKVSPVGIASFRKRLPTCDVVGVDSSEQAASVP